MKTKKVTIKAVVPVYGVIKVMPIFGYVKEITLDTEQIRKCIVQKAIVEEILPNGQHKLLDLSNYDKFDEVEVPEEPKQEVVEPKKEIEEVKSADAVIEESIEETVVEAVEEKAVDAVIEESLEEITVDTVVKEAAEAVIEESIEETVVESVEEEAVDAVIEEPAKYPAKKRNRR